MNTIAQRQAILQEADPLVCRNCGSEIPENAASDESYYIDMRQMPADDDNAPFVPDLLCPNCW